MLKEGRCRSKVEILIADDHELFRKGIRAIVELEKTFQVIAEAANGIQAVRLADKLKPDVIIMDLLMPVLNGVEATSQILKTNPNIRIIALTVLTEPSVIRTVLKEGAAGFICKAELSRNLTEGITVVLKGRKYLSKQSLFELSKTSPDLTANDRLGPHLTARELEVIRHLSLGKSSKQIAFDLMLSRRTVETHRANIMRKLNLHSVTELLHYVLENQLAVTDRRALPAASR
jgi:DNA-binding NarL/FixJ family response regulator